MIVLIAVLAGEETNCVKCKASIKAGETCYLRSEIRHHCLEESIALFCNQCRIDNRIKERVKPQDRVGL